MSDSGENDSFNEYTDYRYIQKGSNEESGSGMPSNNGGGFTDFVMLVLLLIYYGGKFLLRPFRGLIRFFQKNKKAAHVSARVCLTALLCLGGLFGWHIYIWCAKPVDLSKYIYCTCNEIKDLKWQPDPLVQWDLQALDKDYRKKLWFRFSYPRYHSQYSGVSDKIYMFYRNFLDQGNVKLYYDNDADTWMYRYTLDLEAAKEADTFGVKWMNRRLYGTEFVFQLEKTDGGWKAKLIEAKKEHDISKTHF